MNEPLIGAGKPTLIALVIAVPLIGPEDDAITRLYKQMGGERRGVTGPLKDALIALTGDLEDPRFLLGARKAPASAESPRSDVHPASLSPAAGRPSPEASPPAPSDAPASDAAGASAHSSSLAGSLEGLRLQLDELASLVAALRSALSVGSKPR